MLGFIDEEQRDKKRVPCQGRVLWTLDEEAEINHLIDFNDDEPNAKCVRQMI